MTSFLPHTPFHLSENLRYWDTDFSISWFLGLSPFASINTDPLVFLYLSQRFFFFNVPLLLPNWIFCYPCMNSYLNLAPLFFCSTCQRFLVLSRMPHLSVSAEYIMFEKVASWYSLTLINPRCSSRASFHVPQMCHKGCTLSLLNIHSHSPR